MLALFIVGPTPIFAEEAKAPLTAEGREFFEQRIRPVLVEHCHQCHSAKSKELKGNLRLDTRDGMLEGGDTGPAVVPGAVEESLLLSALKWESLEMPPKGKLPDAIIADFERWIRMGAPDPRDSATPDKPTETTSPAEGHWAYQPIQRSALPSPRNSAWAQSPIDLFVLEEMERRGLSPSRPSDKRTLLRRVYFDLIGLPPTFAEIEAFERETSSDAFARVVERLLASPRYGERWGRHWLDVARYADTKDGVLMYGDDRVRPYAYTYRDYVIRALNEDVPIDRFIHEQLAADQLGDAIEPWRMAAMGFLTLGRMFDNNIHDVIDDRIDTVTRGLMGMTASCARCHDHKYDPIGMKDYYSLYAVFASSEAPFELPFVADPASMPGAAEFEAKISGKRKEAREFLDRQHALLTESARQRVADYLVRVATTAPDPLETAIYFLSLAPDDLRPPIVARWRVLIEERARPDDPVFGPWHDLMKIDEGRLGAEAPAIVDRWRQRPAGVARGQANPLIVQALSSAKLSSRVDVARTYGVLLKRLYDESKAPADGPATDRAAREQLLELVQSRESPMYFPKSQTRRYMSRGDTDAFGGKLQELDRLAVQAANAPPRAMVLVDSSEPYEPRIFLRGNPSRPGPRIEKRFLEVVARAWPKPLAGTSGRLDLARAITSPTNPLTTRVLVNRIWMHHFGEPLAPNPGDFGSRSQPPSHPKLLDYLASTFQADGWSLKKVHRRILLSSVYQQSSLDRPDQRHIDPENRYLWRMNRRRLELEAMRDAMLVVSARLDDGMYGRPVNVANDAACRRRTVYGLIDRQSVPSAFRAFDFASPDQTAERRPNTTVPQQALFGLNSPFVIEQAVSLAHRPEVERASTVDDTVVAIYRILLGRQPEADELAAGRQFLGDGGAERGGAPASKLARLEQYAHVLILTNEAMFID